MTKSTTTVTPLFRAAWADMVANDSRLLAIDVRVAILVGGHFNNQTAETYVAQTTVAAKAGVSARTAWQSFQRLVEFGHLTKRRGGRKSNLYGMPVEKVAAYCKTYFEKSRRPLRNMDEKTSQNGAESFAINCEQTQVSNSLNIESLERATPEALAFRKVQTNLADKYGPAVVEGWFSRISVVGIRGSTCVLGAPNKFIKDHISWNFYGALLRAWQAQDSRISEIEIEVTSAM